jgi:hypothetical protein
MALISLFGYFIKAHARFYNAEYQNIFDRNLLNEIRAKQDIQRDYIF